MSSAQPGLEIEDAGLLTTVQDTGRWGYQHYGVSVSGAMDMAAHRRANRLVGNPPEAATLEVTLVGPTLRFETAMRVAVAGAVFELRLDASEVSTETVLHAHPGQRLAFGRRTAGARAYLAVAGGFTVAPVLGSRSTHLRSGMGGLEGLALRAGDRLTAGPALGVPRREPAAARWRRCLPLGGGACACCRVRMRACSTRSSSGGWRPHGTRFDRSRIGWGIVWTARRFRDPRG